ncbi:NAD(P)/FAD-dependent oxidoreductase [Nocardioides sp. WS12]|uniref:protoporphyrinogen/coproporphyrinogen oxidase n=1 Tax=Nocardioides sp. WS12 TaxID=2486272 RepID=UPI0015FB3A24|nr:NAD(P)/FAD-dependent oxidoreductase [Nocardioides sp. WS12]
MQVIVIGGGVAGAAAAHKLKSNGAQVIVLEAADAVGGRTRTLQRDGFAIDTGAIFLMGSYDRTFGFLRDSGHRRDLTRWLALAAVIDDTERLNPVRYDRPWTFLRQPQLRVRDAARIAKTAVQGVLSSRVQPFALDELAAADDGTTLADWSRGSMGDPAYHALIRPLMEPLTGADPHRISAAFTRALLQQPHRTTLDVPLGGLGQVVNWLCKGIDVRLDTPVLDIASRGDRVAVRTATETLEADGVVVATDVLTARQLVGAVAPTAVLDALDSVEPIHAFHVWFGYRTDPWPGVAQDLVVEGTTGPHATYGVLLNNRRAPGSTPPGGQSVSIYLDREQVGDRDRDGIIALARTAVDRAFGPAAPDLTEVFEWPVTLIAPVPGHYRRMQTARDSMPQRIRLAGDFLTHSGIEGALRSGEQAAEDLLRT